MESTRSAGTLSAAIQPETVPCDLSPKARAKALCPPIDSQASSSAPLVGLASASTPRASASVVIRTINAQTGKCVNAETGNRRRENGRMARPATRPASPFWARLEEALGRHPAYQPFNANALSKKLSMSQGSVYRWYDGTGYPELETALKLAKDGGVCVDWLLNNVKPKHPISKDPVLKELLEICEEMDTEGRERVLRAARGELLQQRGESRDDKEKRRSHY
jgi:hypothetical protein